MMLGQSECLFPIIESLHGKLDIRSPLRRIRLFALNRQQAGVVDLLQEFEESGKVNLAFAQRYFVSKLAWASGRAAVLAMH